MQGLNNIASVLSRTFVLRLMAFSCLLGSPTSVLAGPPPSAAPQFEPELFKRATTSFPAPAADAGSEPDDARFALFPTADHPDGKIRIQKTVVGADGQPVPGAALAGFVFEIRDPGTQAVVRTVETNAEGVVSQSLNVGTYDVVETNSRGLIDVTGPAGGGLGVVIVADRFTDVGWTNATEGGETGRIRIDKTVVDAAGLPVLGAALAGFVFEIRDPATQDVVEAVVTNAEGVGLSGPLAPGTYDVVETDSRGLIDVTGPTSATVTASQTTDVGWTNQAEDGEAGRIRIKKAVVDANGLPVPGAQLDGFVFEIRDPATQSVLETVVTNTEGVGLSEPLAAGTYDVVETDSRGLIDVTGPTTVTVSVSQTTEVGWSNQGDGGLTGRIQIQKAVVDAAGRTVPDARLGGFAFEIREQGTQAVVDTVVTNSKGVGVSRPLPPGPYDVVESRSRGLIDVTGATTVTVTGGDIAELAWTNEERAELPPRIRIRKAVVDVAGLPVPGASLAGFVFEIRDAGTQAVAGTVVTNAAGIGRTGPLAPGTYHVVETDSRGLIDVTGPTGGGHQGVVVVADQTTDVSWTNAIDDGRIRIQKAVVDAAGLPVPGAALDGFVFEIRDPATQAVADTVVTDAEGVGLSGPLDPGTYDVVETDRRGLIDVTGPAGGGRGVVVVADQTTDVSWTNAIDDGRIRIQKAVVDAAGLPVPGAELAGFAFEIRNPGTQAVFQTVVTDGEGIGLSGPLDPGTYDVVETDSRGLIDVTGPAGGGQGVVVLSGQTTEVGWVNKKALPGALLIQKVVVDAAGQPVPGASLAGFVFEIRNPVTQAVLGRITTDDQGTALSDTLPPSAYVLVETDSKGHTDITGPTNTTVSSGDTTEVAWLNRSNPLDVGIAKTGPSTAAPGEQIPYTLTVSNLKPDTVRRFTVRDSLPPDVQLISFPDGWTLEGNELYSDTLGPLAPMDSVSYEIAVVATAPGTIRNVVRVRAPGDDNPSNDRAELVTQVRVSPFSDEGLIVGRVYYTTCVTAGYSTPGCDIHDPVGDSVSVEVDCECEPVADSLLPFTPQEEKEVGIPGVRVYLQDGTSAVTDSEGRYHFFGLRPMLWIAKVDATTLPASEEAYLVPLTNRHGRDGYSVFVDLKRSELARADFVEGSRSAAVAEETLIRRAKTLVDGLTLVGGDAETGVETETEYSFYSHLLPVSGQIPGDSTARPPVPPGSVLAAGPPQGRSLLAMGLVEARLDLRSLANGDLGLGGERNRFEDELKSFQVESDDGEVSAGARAALFLKGTVADDYEVTFRLESEETKGSRLFRDIRPDELYPVYGDGSVREFDAQSRGRVFGRVQRGASYLTLGDFNTGLGSYGQTGSRALGQYSRTLNGVLEHYENDRVAINGFASHDRFSQVVDELPAEGISGPYQLKRTDGLINSEKVELITRDRDQPALILRTQSMERFTDYTIEPFTGRLIFKQPISGLDADLNPVSIRVTYEAEGGGDRFWVYGADGQVRPWQNVEIGGGLVRDENPRAEFDLVSLNATVDVGRGTYAFGEFARTDGSANGSGEARRFGLRHTSGRLTANMLFLETDSTFNNPSASFGTGRRELSFRATAHLNEKTRLFSEALRTEDRRSGGLRHGGRIGIERAINDWLDGQVAYRHADESETPATDLSAEPTRDVNSVAARLRATPPQLPKLAISAEFESDVTESDQRRALVGADYDVWDGGRAYARHEFINSFSGLYGLNPEQERNGTVLGISAAYRPGQSVFSEYRVRDVVGGREAQAAVGLRNTWAVEDGTRLSASVERLAPLSAGGNTATALTGGAEFTGDSLWLGSLRAEYWDRNGTDQVFGSIGYGRKISSDLTFLGNSVFSKELSGDRAFERTRLGIAWRETYVSRWNALARYEHRYDADPRATDAETKREAHIFWGHLSYRPSTPLVLRATAASKSVAGERGPIEFEEQSQLLALRSTFDMTTRVDLGLIGRAVFSDFPDDAQYGLGAEVGVLLGNNLRLAVGYNAFGFSDAEFSAQEATDHGPYLHVGFKFDEALFGRRKAPSRPPVRLRCPDRCPDPKPIGPDPVPTDSTPKDPVHTDSIPKDPVHTDSIPKDPVHTDSIPKDPVHTDSIPKDPVHTDSIPKDPVHTDSIPKDPVHTDSIPKDPVHTDSIPKDPVHTDSIPKDSVPTRPWVPTHRPDCPARWRVCKQHMGPDSVATHETVGYMIHVRNLGGDILLQDHLPAGAELVYASRDPSRREYVLTWPSFRLAAGESRTDTVVLRVPARTGRMVNLAVANRDSSSVRTVVTDSVPEIDMVARGPVRARTGDTIGYTLTISNRGDVAAENVVVTAALSPDTAATIATASDNASVTGSVISWDTIPVLGAGELDTVEVTVITPDSLGLISLGGRVTAEGGDLEDSSTAFTVLPSLVAARVEKLLLDPDTVGRGETVGYQIVVQSPPESLTDTITIRDLLPVGAELIFASGDPTRDGSTLTWPPLVLAELESRVDTVVIRVPDVPHRLCNVLGAVRQASSLLVDSITEQCVMVADSAPALDVEIRGPTHARLGTTLKYRVRISNGTGAPLTDAVLFDTLSANVTFVRASHIGDMVASRTWAWDPIDTLGVGGVQEYEITVRAPKDAPNDTALISIRAAGVAGSLSDRSTAYTLVAGECSLLCRLVDGVRRLWYWICWILPALLDPLIALVLLVLLVLLALGGYMLTRFRVTTVRRVLSVKVRSEKLR